MNEETTNDGQCCNPDGCAPETCCKGDGHASMCRPAPVKEEEGCCEGGSCGSDAEQGCCMEEDDAACCEEDAADSCCDSSSRCGSGEDRDACCDPSSRCHPGVGRDPLKNERPHSEPVDGNSHQSPNGESKEAEYLAGWRRAQADYANLKNETAKIKSEYARFAAQGIVEKLIPVLDNMAAATAHAPDLGENKAAKAWADGIGHIMTQFRSIFEDIGVTLIDAIGMPFDPSIHEALIREPAEGKPSDTVLKIIEPGYRLHDRILRPAKVVVAE